MKLAGWGNFPAGETDLQYANNAGVIGAQLCKGAVIARGAGRSYGDAAVGADKTLNLQGLDRFIAFDPASGELTVEAGVSLQDVIATMLPRGFFPAAVPGTQYVTVGGMVAANIHGKNHHKSGGFGRHVRRLSLLQADGRVVSCSRQENTALFHATLGGMGLTGIVLDASFQLIPVQTAYMRQETLVAPDLDSVMTTFEASRDWTYSVAWIDGLAKGRSLGRSLFYRGEHAGLAELDARQRAAPLTPPQSRRLSVPFFFPGRSLNRATVKAFNGLYWWNGARHRGMRIADLGSFFFPLDGISNWNRIYGRRGFIQHQSVIPKPQSRTAIASMLELIARRGNPSFLTVLKLLGPDNDGFLSFPMEGYTLAIDFPVSPDTLSLAQELDDIVARHGGRLYLAKDARQARAMADMGYPDIDRFRSLRRESGAALRFRSLQSERLGL